MNDMWAILSTRRYKIYNLQYAQTHGTYNIIDFWI